MIRSQTGTGWALVNHRDHAVLAGEFAEAWGNDTFAVPEPFTPIHYAVAHHDDGWIARDATATLTKDRKPEAFSRALVGSYSAFEEIDLPNYLKVRGEATAAVAARDPYAAVLVSMHTVNLLTEQADPTTIRPEHRASYHAFLDQQRTWQKEISQRLHASPGELQRGFEFLQCCDNLSLITCSGYDLPRELRHTHPDRDGKRHALLCSLVSESTWRIAPWPFKTSHLTFSIPYREIATSDCINPDAYQTAFAAAAYKTRKVTLLAGS